MLQQDKAPSQLLLANSILDPANLPSLSSPGASDSPFACPFYKFNLDLDNKCGESRFYGIPDIKQHLVRSHSQKAQEELPAFSCTVCHSPFVDEPSKILHLHDGSCRIVAAPEKLSHQDVIKSIETEFTPETSAERQWFAIWNQLFPGHPKPQTPYKKSNHIEEVIDRLLPYLKDSFLAAYPELYHESNIPSLDELMTNVYLHYYNNLPVSRQGPPVDRSSRDMQNAGYSNISSAIITVYNLKL